VVMGPLLAGHPGPQLHLRTGAPELAVALRGLKPPACCHQHSSARHTLLSVYLRKMRSSVKIGEQWVLKGLLTCSPLYSAVDDRPPQVLA
jgi:hypothetical protein